MGRRACKTSRRNQKREKIERPPMLQTEHRGFYASLTWYALQVGGRETGRHLSGNRFFHSQIKHWASWQISTLMRFSERPGGFVEIIIPQFVQKEKPAGKRSSAGSLYTFSPKCVYATSDGTNIISRIQHFVNAFQPVAYCRPAVMCLCCNVRKREPLNVPQ